MTLERLRQVKELARALCLLLLNIGLLVLVIIALVLQSCAS